ncbi:MAG: HAD-IA family hydrolase [Gammaproteobacteria bacterium]|nr:HAD-IA family hydrolase [Gammaproteobacteria bacterium]
MQLKALLLDLDGTLVDTAPDMVATLNRILHRHGEAPVDQHSASKLVSNGAGALVKFGFSALTSDTTTDQLVAEFLADYAQHTCDRSRCYEGMPSVLETCLQNGLQWGVVTNKPLQLSRSLLDGLGLLDSCSILLGGDSLPVKKPDPAPLLHCCMVLNLAASECLYVGDHERDIVAGKSAGMDTAAALWGYIDSDQKPESWGATYLINQPGGLLRLIGEKISG